MLSLKRQYGDHGEISALELCGDAEPTERFTAEFLHEMDDRYVTYVDGVITLRDDWGRVVRYRVTNEDSDGAVVTGELIAD